MDFSAARAFANEDSSKSSRRSSICSYNFQSEREIAIILLSIKNKELQRRFILEALTVMYGNLLDYYGDQGAKERFLAEIKRPNLYDSQWT